MSTSKLQRIALAAALVLGSAVVAGLLVLEVLQQEQQLMERLLVLQKDQAQQLELNQLKRLLERTRGDRELVASYYVASQSDSIDFLNYVEALAAEYSMTLATLGASEQAGEGFSVLNVRYELEGSLAEVETFLQMLENIPYVSKLASVTLQQTGAVWLATTEIDVIILDYETAS